MSRSYSPVASHPEPPANSNMENDPSPMTVAVSFQIVFPLGSAMMRSTLPRDGSAVPDTSTMSPRL